MNAVVGNPPFIRYQTFNGRLRAEALGRALDAGVKLPQLCSSWAPFIVHAASFVRRGGRLAMVVPAELVHAQYAREVLRFLLRTFGRITVRMFQEKMFEDLSEDTVLLLCENFGEPCGWFSITPGVCVEDARSDEKGTIPVEIEAVRSGRHRLTRYLLPPKARHLYEGMTTEKGVARLGDAADVGIGYVTGCNDYFHLTTGEAKMWRVPSRYLAPAVLSLGAWVRPTPPLRANRVNNAVYELEYSEGARNKGERRVLGGIKYKNVDVTAAVNGLGPAIGVSTKSTGNAFRNLTNRMEEALGECTNVHLMYPGFVFGFLHLIKFSKESEAGKPQDASFDEDDKALPSITRYHEVLVALSGRSTITESVMRYESVGLPVYRCRGERAEIWPGYPPPNSPVHFSRFFQRLYDLYDLRFAYPDPDGANIRKEWQPQGPPIQHKFDENLAFPWEVRLAAK